MTGPRPDGARALALGLVDLFPAEAAVELERAGDEDAVALVGGLPPGSAAAVLGHVTPVSGARLLELLPATAAGGALATLEPARAAALVNRMNPDIRRAVLGSVGGAAAREIEELARYPEDTAGSLMDARVLAFHPGTTVGDALRRLRRLPHRRASEVFLVHEDGTLAGAVPLQDLALASDDEPLGALAGPAPLAVQAMASRNEVVEALAETRQVGLVVVDMDDRLLGVIRRDALVQAAQEVASADAQTMVGASKEERALSRPLFAVRKRLPWLVVNLGTAFVAAAVVGLFESTIARFTALAVLLPVVAGQSGNTGAQALAVTMRALALREVRARHALAVCLKELKTSLVNGLAIAAITAMAVLLWSRSPGLTLIIGLSMVLSMMAAGLSGAAIPMALTVLRQDPAQSSSIVLTTVTDVVGFLSVLGIATLMASMI